MKVNGHRRSNDPVEDRNKAERQDKILGCGCAILVGAGAPVVLLLLVLGVWKFIELTF